MCDFCENIYENGIINGETAFKYHGMSIAEENDGFKIAYLTKDYYENDEVEVISQPINYCPICGRKLVE